MAVITAFQSITLDGVMQGPGRLDEDTRGDFVHGGWSNGYQDEVAMRFAGESMSQKGALLFGRRTYEDLLAFWTSTPEPNPFADALVNTAKYVVSRSADTELAWPNSTLLPGDGVAQVQRLKKESELPLTIMGSGELIRALRASELIDQYSLQIFPILLGSGTHLFAPGDRANLELTRSMPTGTGVIIAQYRVLR